MDREPFSVPLLGQVPLLKSEQKAFRADEVSQVEIEVGLFETGKVFVYRCPICGKTEKNDQRMEPACTGPGWMNSHPLEVMYLETG